MSQSTPAPIPVTLSDAEHMAIVAETLRGLQIAEARLRLELVANPDAGASVKTALDRNVAGQQAIAAEYGSDNLTAAILALRES